MIGKIRLESVSYRQFCARVRKLLPGIKPTKNELYDEWCNCLNRYGKIDYAEHARRIARKDRPHATPTQLRELLPLAEAISSFTSPNVFNPWRDVDPLDADQEWAAAERRARLSQHFDCQPKYLLVGEAPGYQGCHFSGVPFTNEKLLLSGLVPRVTVEGRITQREKPWSEPSASIVWAHLHALGIADQVVMWNAFAWHPHKAGGPMSNRAPTPKELMAGAHVLLAVTERFKGAKIIAVGKVAAKALSACYVRIAGTVRHPSMGGANQFRSELAALCLPPQPRVQD